MFQHNTIEHEEVDIFIEAIDHYREQLEEQETNMEFNSLLTLTNVAKKEVIVLQTIEQTSIKK